MFLQLEGLRLAMQDVEAPGQVPYFVKRVISSAMDRHNR